MIFWLNIEICVKEVRADTTAFNEVIRTNVLSLEQNIQLEKKKKLETKKKQNIFQGRKSSKSKAGLIIVNNFLYL